VSFLRYSMSKFVVILKSGSKVIETDTYRSATYDFVLTFHSNNGPISHRFRDRRRFQSKIAKKFSTPVYIAPPLTGFPLEFGVGAQDQKKLESWATGQRKKFDDILYSAIWIQYTNVTDGRTPGCSKDRAWSYAHSVARVKIPSSNIQPEFIVLA